MDSEHPASHYFEKAASALDETRGIMKRIYDENPSYFPYGLNVGQLDGGCWMIREASTKAPVGFVGWQERPEGFKKIGYYAVGVLPEYRSRGYGKKAVAQLISQKSASVDEVRAFIVEGNRPSMALAASLDIPVVHKSASFLKSLVPAIKGLTQTAAPALKGFAQTAAKVPRFAAGLGEGQKFFASPVQGLRNVSKVMFNPNLGRANIPVKGGLLGATAYGLGSGAVHAYGDYNTKLNGVADNLDSVPNYPHKPEVVNYVREAARNPLKAFFPRLSSNFSSLLAASPNPGLLEQGADKFTGAVARHALGRAVYGAQDLSMKPLDWLNTMFAPGYPLKKMLYGNVRHSIGESPDEMHNAAHSFMDKVKDTASLIPSMMNKSSNLSVRLATIKSAANLLGKLRAGLKSPAFRTPAKWGLGTAVGLDVAGQAGQMNDKGGWAGYSPFDADNRSWGRGTRFLTNLAFGAAAPGLAGSAGAVAKDVGISSFGPLAALERHLNNSAKAGPPQVGLDPSTVKMLAGLGLGVGALGVGGAIYAGNRGANALQAIAADTDKGHVKVTLPTKRPGDAETTIQLPMSAMSLSSTLESAIARDTKRRLRAESKARVQHKGVTPVIDEASLEGKSSPAPEV